MKKTILITGASGGIGKETTLYFANNNWTVIATMISIELAEDLLTTPNVFCYELNVTSTESIAKAKTYILQKHKKIDVVLNNSNYKKIKYETIYSDLENIYNYPFTYSGVKTIKGDPFDLIINKKEVVFFLNFLLK